MQQLNNLKATTKYFSIGKTVLNKNIWCFVLGDNFNKKIIVQGAIHAREYLTSLVIIDMIKYLKNFDFDATIYFVPLVNVDGVKVVMQGLKPFVEAKQALLKKVDYVNNLKLYKANLNAVDLNVNFDANWGGGKSNVNYQCYQNYIGPHPNSEPETQALINLTNMVKPDATISYHLKGEVVYYGFLGQDKNTFLRDKNLAKFISKKLNYQAKQSKNSAGGYKDFCTTYYGMPAFTIEVAKDKLKHPIPDTELDCICRQNRNILLHFISQLERV